ncbi:hypothetical protein GGS20DRAFT_593264 [Poronia punctata]|nr:hypothetical protein GGS20DRAFT_593264 [Poronia punctata]
MPYFRGIEIFVHASLGARQIAEYPHPDASSVSLRKTATLASIRDAYTGTNRNSLLSGSNPAAARDEIDPTCQKKLNPRISVYIPSLPGEQFWMRYLVTQCPAPSRILFFKMTMNGRYISSWGINTDARCTGSVVRALYKPGGHWGHTVDPEDQYFTGIETRYFHFMPGLENQSIADDGGIIEVQVFRCKGRKRIAPILDPYRNQERYGIASPSGGIVDNPEDATYYNYYLIDPRDAPYATFCFHYRSMKYLEQLNLVPQLGPAMSPASKLHRPTQEERLAGILRSDNASTPEASLESQASPGFHSCTPEPYGSGEICEAEDEDNATLPRTNMPSVHYLRSSPELSPSSLDDMADTVSDDLSNSPGSEPMVGIRRRPLPEVPGPGARPQSASSLRSNCPSLTPSLRQYVESDDFDNEEIRLSTAQPLLIPSESMQAMELGSAEAGDHASVSDYAASSDSSEATDSPKLPSPANYIPTTGSVLERHLTQYDSPLAKSSPFSLPKMACSTDTSPRGARYKYTSDNLGPADAEWLRHPPSPLRGESERGLDRWKCNRRPNRVSLDGVTPESNGSPRAVKPRAFSRRNSLDTGDKTPAGNWI